MKSTIFGMVSNKEAGETMKNYQKNDDSSYRHIAPFFYSKFERTVASPNFIPGRKGT